MDDLFPRHLFSGSLITVKVVTLVNVSVTPVIGILSNNRFFQPGGVFIGRISRT